MRERGARARGSGGGARWYFFEVLMPGGRRVYDRVRGGSSAGAVRRLIAEYPVMESYRRLEEPVYRALKAAARPGGGGHRERPPGDDPGRERAFAAVLGLSGRVTFGEIKSRYRELLAQYHPDRVHGLGPELQELAERKTRQINEAYAYFKERYE